MKYPEVLGEFETMRLANQGWSLARAGDGECKAMYGAGYRRQDASLKLATELFNVMNHPAPQVLPCIPTMDPNGPKYDSWIRHKERFERVLHRHGPWGSAFVTRPDSAPWIETPDYLELVLSLWRDKSAVLVAEETNKMLPLMFATASNLSTITCPSHQAYALIDDFESRVLAARADIAILCVGVTATCLANRLAGKGLHAIDFGSAGGMMVRLYEEKYGKLK